MSDSGWAPSTHALGWVEGPDAVSFLDGQVSQDVASMVPGEVRRSLLLEPRGKLRGLLWLLRGEARVGVVAWADTLDEMIAELNRFRFRVDAEIRRDERLGTSVWGGPDGAGTWEEQADTVTMHPRDAQPGTIVFGGDPPVDVPEWDTAQVEARRLVAGEPRFGVDLDESTIPQESGLVSESVSFTKGCYLGQELVARIDSRGRVNRHLRLVDLAHEAPSGALVVHDGDEVGTLTTVAVREDGAPVGMGVIRREAEPGAEVVVRWDGGETKGTVRRAPREALTDAS